MTWPTATTCDSACTEITHHAGDGVAIELPVAGLPFLPLLDDPGIDQRVGVMAEQGQADPGVLRHLSPGGLTAVLSEEVHDAEPGGITERLEHGNPLLRRNSDGGSPG